MHIRTSIFFVLVQMLVAPRISDAQMITGVWRGKIGSGLKTNKVELKLIQKGDSLYGTSYYYESASNYCRYTIKGYFNNRNNTVMWWDDVLLEEKSPAVRLLSPAEIPLLSEADFNCPGSGIMLLDGNAVTKDDLKEKGPLHLSKVERPVFSDPWDELIENYTIGGNDPEWITEVAQQQLQRSASPKPTPAVPEKPAEQPVLVKKETSKAEEKPVISAPKHVPPVAVNPPPAVTGITEKFAERKKLIAAEIPLEGDSILLHFYDNAEIDGDSISLFLNNRLVFEHIRLSDKPYEIKISIQELLQQNELVMVAENLGSIPPNTSYMIAWLNGKRYTAQLESTENSSAVIRLTKKE